MNKIKGILFDKDGTLLDFNRTWLPAYRRAAGYLFGRYGAVAEPGGLLAAGGFLAGSGGWAVDSVLASGANAEIVAVWEGVIGRAVDDVGRRALEEIFSRATAVPVVDDLAGFLGGLRGGGFRVGVATMDSEANARGLLRAVAAEGVVDFVCGADSGFGVKPEVGMVQAFCRCCGLDAAQVAMVGDSPKDLRMGGAAGVGLVVGVLSGAHVAADLEPLADLVLGSIAELPGVLGVG